MVRTSLGCSHHLLAIELADPLCVVDIEDSVGFVLLLIGAAILVVGHRAFPCIGWWADRAEYEKAWCVIHHFFTSRTIVRPCSQFQSRLALNA